MKTIIAFCIGVLCAAGLFGCQTTFLQNFSVDGPMFQPPVHIVRDSAATVELHPWVSKTLPQSVSGLLRGHSQVNSHGVYSVDTIKSTTPYSFTEPNNVNTNDFRGTNFTWQFPSAVGGADLDIHVTESVALGLGGSYASVGGNSYWQAYGDFGTISSGKNISARFDMGVVWQSMQSDVDFVYKKDVFFGTDTVWFYNFHNSETQVNYFGN